MIWHPLSVTSEGQTSERASAQNAKLREAHDWTGRTINLLSDVAHDIQETCLVWDSFAAGDIGYLRGNPVSEPTLHPAGRSLAAVEKSFMELRLLERRLEHMKSRCTEFAKTVRMPD